MFQAIFPLPFTVIDADHNLLWLSSLFPKILESRDLDLISQGKRSLLTLNILFPLQQETMK